MYLHMRKKSMFLISMLVLGLVAQACNFISEPQEAALEPISIKVATLPFMSFAPFFLAESEGLYEKNGLEVEFVKMTPREIIPAVTQGLVDVSAGFVSVGVLNAMARDGTIKVVADKGYIDPAGCSSNAILARQDLAQTDSMDADMLRGKKIDVLPASWNQYYLDKALSTVGLTSKDMELVNIPTPSEPEALTNGSLDFTAQGEPWVTRIKRAGHKPILTPIQELMPDSQFAVIYFGPNILEDNPEMGHRFMAAYLEAVRQYNEGKTEVNLAIISEKTGLDKELLQETCWPGLRNDGQINIASIMDFQDWAVQNGFVDTPVSEDKIWDSQFVEDANQKLSKLSQ